MFIFYLLVPILYLADYWLNKTISKDQHKEERFMKKSTYFIFKKGEFLNLSQEKKELAYHLERVFILPFFILLSAISIVSHMLFPVTFTYAGATLLVELGIRYLGDSLVREQMRKTLL